MYTIGLSCPPQGKNCINYDLNSHIKIIHTVHYKIVAISHKLKGIMHFCNMHMHITNQGHTRGVLNWHSLARPLLQCLIPEHLPAVALAYC